LISFASEMADVCESVGADAFDVERALRSDRRIGAKAPIRPGFGFAGGTLGRDVQALRTAAREQGIASVLMDAVLAVNGSRVPGLVGKLATALGGLAGRTVALLGLTYKPGTDTLRRSVALEIARALAARGARTRAFDPRVRTLPEDISSLELAADPFAAAEGADALVLATEWPEFKSLDWAALGSRLRRPLVFDLKGLLDPATPGIDLRRVGVPS
jgi:UDPglucose 6-dehydrogenase